MTTPLKDHMRVRHGTKILFTLRSGGGKILEQRTMPFETLGGALTLAGFMYNRLTMSGGVAWWNPTTGRPIKKPTWSAVLIDPADELTGDQTCDCPTCR